MIGWLNQEICGALEGVVPRIFISGIRMLNVCRGCCVKGEERKGRGGLNRQEEAKRVWIGRGTTRWRNPWGLIWQSTPIYLIYSHSSFRLCTPATTCLCEINKDRLCIKQRMDEYIKWPFVKRINTIHLQSILTIAKPNEKTRYYLCKTMCFRAVHQDRKKYALGNGEME